MNFDKIGGRRFLFTATCLAICTWLRWADKLPAADFVAIVNWIGTVYMGANIGQRAIEARAAVSSETGQTKEQ